MLTRYGFEPFVEGLEYALDLFGKQRPGRGLRGWSPGVFSRSGYIGP